MKTEKTRQRLYLIYAGGAALATASSIAGTIWAIYAIFFGIVGQLTFLKDNVIVMLVGVVLSLAAGVASYRWAFNYFMTLRKDV